MFSLTVCFGPTNMVWAFLFKEKESAEGVFDAIHKQLNDGNTPYIRDDYGQRAVILPPVAGICLEDLDQVEEARILRTLADARAQVKAKQRAQGDAVIRQAQQGPAVIQPMGGRFNG